MDNGQISTSADYAIGGNISLTVPNLLYLQEGVITTSVHGGIGDGGNININNPTFVVLNQGQIRANADEGNGGNIRIIAKRFIKSPESLISASSRLGLDGNVQVNSPAVDMDAMLLVLPRGHLEAQLQNACNIKDISELSTFYIHRGREGMMRTPEGFPE